MPNIRLLHSTRDHSKAISYPKQKGRVKNAHSQMYGVVYISNNIELMVLLKDPGYTNEEIIYDKSRLKTKYKA